MNPMRMFGAFLLCFFAFFPFSYAGSMEKGPTESAANRRVENLDREETPSPSEEKNDEKKRFIDQGDYYFLRNGKKASFVRRTNRYLLIDGDFKIPRAKTLLSVSEKAVETSDTRFEVIKKNHFGRFLEIKVHDTEDPKKILSDLTGRDPSIRFVSPVFTTWNMQGQIAVLPQIIICFTDTADPQEMAGDLKKLHLSLSKKLPFSHSEYEYDIDEPVSDTGRVFELTRSVTALKGVKWAEPNFISGPEKTLIPDDPLFIRQWYLDNPGKNGALLGADISAPDGWDYSQGSGVVIAIFDDGVDTAHEDLNIWRNPGESGDGKETNGIDDDGNGYIDDFQGWDFEDEDNSPIPLGVDANHGTCCAGVAGAIGNNGLGVVGSAPGAVILPIKSGGMPCTAWAAAMRYAGKYADVVSASWSMSTCENAISSAIEDVVTGKIANARRGSKGVPVIFASGNNASGWNRFEVSGFVSGTYTFQWKYAKNESNSEGYDTVWLDEITWPGGEITGFEESALGDIPQGFTSNGDASWLVVSDEIHAFGARGNSVKAGSIVDNETSILSITKQVGAGSLIFWAWVSSEYNADFLEFSISGHCNGIPCFTFSPGQYGGHQNEVGFPASDEFTIAVGASTDGLGGIEQRAPYSQFGPELDVVAPSDGGGQGVMTTDRTGSAGYNDSASEFGGDYFSSFGGTSAAAPLVAGVVADIIAYYPDMTAEEIRTLLRDSADKIGPYPYSSDGRNDYYGYGRVNLYNLFATPESATIEHGNPLYLSDNSDDYSECFIGTMLRELNTPW